MEEFTREQLNISQRNRNNARAKIFGEEYKYGKPGWVLHHKDETLRHNDVERYIEWNVEDLVPMTNEEHCRIHHLGNQYFLGHRHTDETIQKMREIKSHVSDETREKMRQAQLGKKASDEARRKMSLAKIGNKCHLGKKVSEEGRMKMRECHLGKPLSESTKEKLTGLKFYNNGVIMVRARECPAGFVAGRLIKQK